MRYLDLDLMRDLCHVFAVAHFNKKDDPIAPFETCNMGLLDSALNSSRQTFGGVDLYKSLEEKAAILYYSLVKNHAFQNGNKRIATATLLIFLDINGFWLDVSPVELADWTIKVAVSIHKDEIIFEIIELLQANLKTVAQHGNVKWTTRLI